MFKKEECYWSFIYPDPDFGFSSNMEPQGVSDLFLYHSYNNHYDLLVEPENFPGRFLDRFPNGEMIGNRDDDSPKAKQKDCTNEKFLEEDISDKQHAATLKETTSDAMHDETDEVMNIEGIDIHQSREVTVSTRKKISNLHATYVAASSRLKWR